MVAKAHLRINDDIGCGKTFVPGQLFTFGSIVLHADSTGRLGQVENFSPGQAIRFGNLEYAADSRGDLAFSGRVCDQPEDPSSTTVPAPDSISKQDHGSICNLELDLSSDPNTGQPDQASSPTS